MSGETMDCRLAFPRRKESEFSAIDYRPRRTRCSIRQFGKLVREGTREGVLHVMDRYCGNCGS